MAHFQESFRTWSLLQHRHKELEVLSNSVTPVIVNTCRSGYTLKKYLKIYHTVIIVAHSFRMSNSRIPEAWFLCDFG